MKKTAEQRNDLIGILFTILILLMKYHNIIFEASRYILIVLFIYTGLSKLIGYYLFLDQLRNIIFLEQFSGFISVTIPLLEIFTGMLLAVQRTEMAGWWLSASLLSIFSIYVTLMLLFVPNLPCSCGGIIASLNWKQHLIVNMLLASVCWFRLHRHYYILKLSMHTRE